MPNVEGPTVATTRVHPQHVPAGSLVRPFVLDSPRGTADGLHCEWLSTGPWPVRFPHSQPFARTPRGPWWRSWLRGPRSWSALVWTWLSRGRCLDLSCEMGMTVVFTSRALARTSAGVPWAMQRARVSCDRSLAWQIFVGLLLSIRCSYRMQGAGTTVRSSLSPCIWAEVSSAQLSWNTTPGTLCGSFPLNVYFIGMVWSNTWFTGICGESCPSWVWEVKGHTYFDFVRITFG